MHLKKCAFALQDLRLLFVSWRVEEKIITRSFRCCNEDLFKVAVGTCTGEVFQPP